MPRGTSFINDEWNHYLKSEVTLVVEECLVLEHDRPALEKYLHDRLVMATAIMQVSYALVIR